MKEEVDELSISQRTGTDIFLETARNGEENRRAYQTKPWPSDYEIYGGEETTNTDNHEYVDLGLPSGTLWATENIKDANGDELYFAWGETQGYTAEQVGNDKYFAWSGDNADYKYGTYNERDEDLGMTKYNNTDGKTELDTEDDAATANWGSNWRMPTKKQFEELTGYTSTSWTQVDGVKGLLFTSTANTNTLFFPAVGYAEGGGVYTIGNEGFYWSVVSDGKDVNNASKLGFGKKNLAVVKSPRYYGCSVRPVRS